MHNNCGEKKPLEHRINELEGLPGPSCASSPSPPLHGDVSIRSALLAHAEHLNMAHHTPPAGPGLFPPQITGSALTKKGRAWSLVPFYGMVNSYAIILQ